MKMISNNSQYAANVNTSPFFKKNDKNFINILSSKQLNTLDHLSMLDIFLSKDHIIEPHYHPNASELTYCVSGSATISMMNLDTKIFQHYKIVAGQVVNIPQGWWHYQIAHTDDTHLQGIFNVNIPEVVLGSDILTATPADVFAYSYGLDEQQWAANVKAISPSQFIGPPTK
ncbi:cupin [Sporosarcina sp. P12(2017)]|uniref:cupin domain-containing protein n=1 Tax=unclassified Sporosarcina TaxID=2647733 RepID=UPI000C16EBDB|nr:MULTISPECIES: cupin domain-containing protein [unclassified Sporosarcina]PIC55937.1 cupin [Sporosarcina sp. P10]PIC59257.1 cupin [Sporosarcina sp. P12(2017)]